MAPVKSTPERHPGGRPPKFNEASRPVTVTLPERVLRLLAQVSPDRAKAITKLVDRELGVAGSGPSPVDLVEVAPGKAVILVAHSSYLENIPWLRLVEVAPGRHLLSLAPGTSIEKLEVAIGDLLEAVPESDADQRDLLEALRKTIRTPRRNQKLVKEEILFVESA
jgi:hypothetical protein